jgi:hypothetical protein
LEGIGGGGGGTLGSAAGADGELEGEDKDRRNPESLAWPQTNTAANTGRKKTRRAVLRKRNMQHPRACRLLYAMECSDGGLPPIQKESHAFGAAFLMLLAFDHDGRA